MKGHRWFAAIYDRLMSSAEKRWLRKMREEMVATLTGRVLEIGAGTGASLAYYRDGVDVIATEPDPYMLERARKRLAELGATNIELAQHPAEQLPFEDGSFDTAVSTMVFCSVRDPKKALAEIRRVLKPSGSFRFIEHVRPDGGLKARVFDAITPVWSWFGAGCHPNRRTLESIKYVGFEVAELQRVSHSGMPVVIGVAIPAGSAKQDSQA